MNPRVLNILITSVMLCTFSNAQAQAKFKFEDKSHKFKACEEGTQLEHQFNFTNVGDEPLILSKYEVACTCTKVEFSKEPILPGESGFIDVTFDTKGKTAWQYRSIFLYSNAKKSPFELEVVVKVLN